MAIFRWRNQSQGINLSSELGCGDLCAQEALDNRAAFDPSEVVEMLSDNVGAFGAARQQLAEATTSLRDYMQSSASPGTRNAAQVIKETVYSARQDALNKRWLRVPDFDPNNPTITEVAALGAHVRKIRSTIDDSQVKTEGLFYDASGTLIPYDTYIRINEAFDRIFLADKGVRFGMSQLHTLNAGAFRIAFSSATIPTLDPRMRDLAVLDIRKGRSRSVILAAHANARESETNESRFQKLLKNNEVSPASREFIAGLCVAASVIGMPECSANQFGLCSRFAGRIALDQLPTSVVQDMEGKEQVLAGAELRRLEALAASSQVSRLLEVDSFIDFRRTSQSSSAASKRKRGPVRAQAPVVTNQDVDNLLRPELQTGGKFSQIQMQIKGDRKDAPVVFKEEDMQNDVAFRNMLAGHLKVGVISDFISEYSRSGRKNLARLEEFLVDAMSMILTSPSYLNRELTFAPLSDKDLGDWRLSSNKMPASRRFPDVRILFREATDSNGVRRVTITKIGMRNNVYS